MRKYAGIIKNDIVNGNGVCVSFFVQGCPIHCPDCHNKDNWDFNGGYNLPENYLEAISEAITANGLERNFSLLGGEPLCEENIDLSIEIVEYVRNKFPNIDICIWTGYKYEDLIMSNNKTKYILSLADVLIDGPFVKACRDISLKMRGSTNQRMIDLKKSTSDNLVLKVYK